MFYHYLNILLIVPIGIRLLLLFLKLNPGWWLRPVIAASVRSDFVGILRGKEPKLSLVVQEGMPKRTIGTPESLVGCSLTKN